MALTRITTKLIEDSTITNADISASFVSGISGSFTQDMTLATASIAANETNMTLATASIAAITSSVAEMKEFTKAATISGSFTSVSSSIATRFDSRETDMTLATASIAAITASLGQPVNTDSNVQFADITSTGTITAVEVHTTFVSSSIAVSSGSNNFGDELTDLHSFTGSLAISGSTTTLVSHANVGIGTTNPDGPLHVSTANVGTPHGDWDTLTLEENGRCGLTIITPNDNYGAIDFADGDGNEQGMVQYKHATNDMYLKTAGTSRIFISGSGEVGIGTTAPTDKLTIDHTSDPWIAIKRTNASTQINKIGTDSAGLYFQSYGHATGGNNQIVFMTEDGDSADSPTERMRIESDGKVGIGTNAPRDELDVVGNININGSGTRQIKFDNGSTSEGAIVFDEISNGLILKVGGTSGTGKKDALHIHSASIVSMGSSIHETRVSQKLALTAHGGSDRGGMAINCFLAGSNSALLDFNKSRNNTAGSHTVVNSGDAIGTLIFRASDGDEFIDAAAIDASVDGTPGNNDMPGRLSFFTTADGSNSLSERMRITSAGNVGIGTTSMMQDFGDGRTSLAIKGTDSADYATLQMGNYGTSGNDQILGHIAFYDGTSRNASISAQRQTGTDDAYITFATSLSGGSVTERMRIDRDGNVGIGNTSPDRKLVVEDNTAADYVASFRNEGNNANRYGMIIYAGADDGSGTTDYISCQDGDGTQVGYIRNTSGTFALTDVSDKRLKENIRDTEVKGLDVVSSMKVRDFEWKKSGDTCIGGFVAQELESAFAPAVTGEDGDLEEDGRIKPMGVSRERLVPVLVKAIQELSEKVESQQKEIEELKK